MYMYVKFAAIGLKQEESIGSNLRWELSNLKMVLLYLTIRHLNLPSMRVIKCISWAEM